MTVVRVWTEVNVVPVANLYKIKSPTKACPGH